MSIPTCLEIHSHSTISDGRYEPEEVAEFMKEAGVDLWSLTDHDTVAGCRRAREAAEALGVGFVSGIEISADHHGDSIHVLGYGVDIDDPKLGIYGEEMVRAREDRMAKMVEQMCALGFEVTLEEVLEISGGGNVGRPHLARALVKRGHVDQMQQAFDRWLAAGQPGYVAMARPTVPETIDMIRQAGGLVVLAHPARYRDLSGQLSEWKERGLWGLEVRHPSHDREDEARLLAWADRIGLGTTASNDWHGNHPSEKERLGTVRFPREWREGFCSALQDRGLGTEV